jgi:phage anti-repressor protein
MSKKSKKSQKIKNRDYNIFLSMSGEISMKQKSVPPKKGKGAKYKRKTKRNNKDLY